MSEQNSPSEPSEISAKASTAKPSLIKPPSTASSLTRIARPCSHLKLPDVPLAPTPTSKKSELKSNEIMRRQSDDYKAHQLPDVDEESEYDLLSERFGHGSRSTKSKSPESLKYMRSDRKSSSGFSSDSFFEATGRRSSSDHGADLTTDTDSFMIGQRVYVGGVRPGRITFIGEVHFAPGDWAGIVLDQPEGKNDGAVSGKRYFQCEPKKGIFSRLTRLTREPLTSGIALDSSSSMDTSFRSMTSPVRSDAASPTHSVSSNSKTPFGTKSYAPEIDERVIVKSATGSKAGFLRFKGEPAFASGVWCGVEFEEPVGKNDGSVGGNRYFTCAPNHGIFVPASKVELSPLARKNRLSRANSQESLSSNITLGSLASTNTSKLRLNATQKRLSTFKAPNASSTPKPSFSLQDILREKTNHIEQLMKERESDREEMTSQTVLFQRNISQYKEKMAKLESQLEDERKKAEDLQFTIDEATITAEESNAQIKKYQDQINQLEKSLEESRRDTNAAGDFVEQAATHDIEKLANELKETHQKLNMSEELKKNLEQEIQSLHEQLESAQIELELKTCGAKASEECLKEEFDYFEQRIKNLEGEITQKDEDINAFKADIAKFETTKNVLEEQMNEKAAAFMKTENSLTEQLLDKENKIQNLLRDIENLVTLDAAEKHMLAEKDSEISRLTSDVSKKDDELKKLLENIENINETLCMKENEQSELKKVLASTEDNLEKSRKDGERKLDQLTEKISQLKTQEEKMASMKQELEIITLSIANSDSFISKAGEQEIILNREIHELQESKAKLEIDIYTKDERIKRLESDICNTQQNADDLKETISELEQHRAYNEMQLAEKESLLCQLTKSLEDSKSRDEKLIKEMEASKNASFVELTSMQQAIDELKRNNNEEVCSLKTQIEDLSKSIGEKDLQLDSLTKQIILSNELKTTHQEKIIAQDKELQNLTSKFSNLEKDFLEKTKNQEKLQKTFDETSKRMQETQSCVKKLQEDKDVLEVDKNDLNRKLVALDEKVAQLLEQKAKLQQDLQYSMSSTLDTNSELTKMHDDLKEKQTAFEVFQAENDKIKLELERRVDELERQRSSLEESYNKVSSELQMVQSQKIENENQLNQDLANYKQTSNDEKDNLIHQIRELRAAFESEKSQMIQEMRSAESAYERIRGELEDKKNAQEAKVAELANEIMASKATAACSETSLRQLIEEMKLKDQQMAEVIEQERNASDQLKKLLETEQASTIIQANEYEGKLIVAQNKIAKLEDDLLKVMEQQKSSQSNDETNIRILEEIQQKCYSYEQEIRKLNNQIVNELSMKDKLEISLKESQLKLSEIEEEQVDLVNRNEEYKVQSESNKMKIEELQQCRASLDEKLIFERKESEDFKILSEHKQHDLVSKINTLQDAINAKEQENNDMLQKLNSKNDESIQLQTMISELNLRQRCESESTLQLINQKESELINLVNECAGKDILIADMKNNLENLKSCLKTIADEKQSSVQLIQSLNNNIAQRDSAIEELKLKLYELESIVTEKENQLKNICTTRERSQSESQEKISNLIVQLSLLEEVKHKEVEDLACKLQMYQSQIQICNSEIESSTSQMKIAQSREHELLRRIKNLELSETELMITNQSLKIEIDEMKNNSLIPRVDIGNVQDNDEQIAFLNSIIADMHKKNLKLTKQVQSLEVGCTSLDTSSNGLNLEFLKKKKPAPRVYCDICEIFDSHETEDCPLQSSDIDLPPASKESKKERKLPPPRKYCERCEMFDHENGNCPDDDETY